MLNKYLKLFFCLIMLFEVYIEDSYGMLVRPKLKGAFTGIDWNISDKKVELDKLQTAKRAELDRLEAAKIDKLKEIQEAEHGLQVAKDQGYEGQTREMEAALEKLKKAYKDLFHVELPLEAMGVVMERLAKGGDAESLQALARSAQVSKGFNYVAQHEISKKKSAFEEEGIRIAKGLIEKYGGHSKHFVLSMFEDLQNVIKHESLNTAIINSILNYISNNININVQDNGGFTALNYVSFFGGLEIAKLLIAAGANPNMPNNYGTTPLYTVLFAESIHRNGDPEIFKLLIESGADVCVKGGRNNILERFFGMTPLEKIHFDLEKGYFDRKKAAIMIKLLEKAGGKCGSWF